MTKIVLDSNKVKDTVIPNLDNSIKNLGTAIDMSESISIPYDFAYYKTLKNVFSDVKNIEKKIKAKKEYLDNFNKTMQNTMEQIDDSFILYSKQSFDMEIRKDLI